MAVNLGRSVHCNRGFPSRRGLVMVESMAARRAMVGVVVVVDDVDDDKDEEQVDDTAVEKARIGTRREEARMVNASAIEDTFISPLEIRMTKKKESLKLVRRERTAGSSSCC